MLIYAGLRVTNLRRSLRFYSGLLGLEEIARGGGTKDWPPIYVLLRDSKSHQKLELNWYPKSHFLAPPYVPGEGLDHLGFRVANVVETLGTMKKARVRVPKWAAEMRKEMVDVAGYRSVAWITSKGHHVAYVLDPDGNYVELYDHPEDGENFRAPKAY
jgi:catechol 2,3-dioxygenase-like lactoylglutathione lyase family enzyme